MPRRDLAIDFGTANTRIYVHGEGIVYDEPTVVALNSRTGEVLAVGSESAKVVADSASAVAVRPMQRGAITDFELTLQMMRAILRRLGLRRFTKARALVCVPTSLTGVERRALEEAVTSAGAHPVSLVEQPFAAALGAGLPIHSPMGNLVVDVGAGLTEVAMVAMGGVILAKTVAVGGFDMDAAIQSHLRRRHGIAIGDGAAERLKIELGSAYPAADSIEVQIHGRELASGLPVTVAVTPEEVRQVLGDGVRAIYEATRRCLAESPPELAHDVLETGVFLTGGGGLLRGLEMRLAQECEVPVHLTERPLTTVAMGAGRLLEAMPEVGGVFEGAGRRR